MKEYTIRLNAQQVLALYDMCEKAQDLIHKAAKGTDAPVPAFNMVISIQNKLDGCENLQSTEPSLVGQADCEVSNQPNLFSKEFNTQTPAL